MDSILILDRSTQRRSLLRILLERAGFQVYGAADTDVAAVQIRCHTPSLVLVTDSEIETQGLGVTTVAVKTPILWHQLIQIVRKE